MSSTANLLDTDPGRELLVLLVGVCKQKLLAAMLPPKIRNDAGEMVANPDYVAMPAGELSAIRQLLSDNSVTLANIRRGDFGESVQRAEENFPFPDNGRSVQ